MSLDNQYDYLSGAVTIKADGPEEWRDLPVLPFWDRPNDPAWGKLLCRVLYHEAVHFWQFLSSPYIASLVSEEWGRMIHLETTGKLAPESEFVRAFSRKVEPFSPAELVECWARYWDVHTRGPLAIIEEESISVANRDALEFRGFYTDSAYDTVMTNGSSCHLYARPYRWLLDQAEGNSMLANVLFPILTNAAFTTLDPVRFFLGVLETAVGSDEVREVVLSQRGQAINLSWLKCWDIVAREAIPRFIKHAGDDGGRLTPFKKAGYQVIEGGSLRSHPIFAQYAIKGHGANFMWWFHSVYEPHQPGVPQEYTERLRKTARAMPIWAPHGMPGQPWYRSTLGALVPPPVASFQNYTWFAPWVLQVGTAGNAPDYRAENGRTFLHEYKELAPRIQRFRYTQEAVRNGLPPNALN